MIDFNHWSLYYYQIKEIMAMSPESVLIVGKGEGVVDDYLRKQNIHVLSVDIDTKTKPDVVGDIRNLSHLVEPGFDVVVCCEVLEHLPRDDIEHCLQELSYVAGDALIISVPYNGWFFNVHVDAPLFHDKYFNMYLNHKKILRKGKHQWELDTREMYSWFKDCINRFFMVYRDYRCPVFPYVHFFCVEVKQ